MQKHSSPQDLLKSVEAILPVVEQATKTSERVTSADGATGWLVMIGAGGGLFSGFMQEAAAREIFLPERAVIAGSGMPSGVATRTEDGFEVSGRWAYASGAYHASWFTANCKIDGNDNGITSVAVPAGQVKIHQTWSVFGMKATGSQDLNGISLVAESDGQRSREMAHT